MPRSTRTKKTRETIYIRLPVKIEYDTPAARKYAIKRRAKRTSMNAAMA